MRSRRSRHPDRVAVITGASSGIGRATAHAFASQGGSLVLAARGEESLHEVAQECRALGAEAEVVVADVSRQDDVETLLQAAVGRFGRLDVWVCAASVFSYGTFEETPPAVFRQVVETNFFGQVHSARAVLPLFREQGAGVLVLVGSLYSRVTSPYLSPYITSKWALLALAEVLQQELRRLPRVHVCAVLPATVDTPVYQHAANHTGRAVHPLPPVVDPRRVARAVVRLADRPRRVTVVGQVQRTAAVLHAAAPWLYHRAVGPAMDLLALREQGVEPSEGTVFTPDVASNQVSGGWRSGPWRSRPAALVLVPAAVALLRSRRYRDERGGVTRWHRGTAGA